MRHYIRQASAFKFNNLDLRILKTKARKKVKYIDLVCAFDIETTNIDKYRQAVMYIWQLQLGEQWTVYGRTWEEFKQFTDKLSDLIPSDAYLVVYVHNLSFEFQFLKSIIPVDDVFAMDDRKILRIRSGRLEFRCSYLHSNMSLDRYLKAMNVPDQKIKGFDYKKKRYPWTTLTKAELRYCINDVRGLVQAVTVEMSRDGDDLYTIPLTSTGYSRRLAKAALGGYRKYIKDMLPDLDTFQALRRAFRGGDTHANRYNANIIIDSSKVGGIQSWDISSSYPAVMLTERFPRRLIRQDPQQFDLLYKSGKACLIHLYMEDVKLHDPRFGSPYIPKAKCESLFGAQLDNGRVLSADHLDMYVTEVDFEILAEEYDFRYQILDLWTGTKSYLPDAFRELLMQTYKDKTILKGGDAYTYGKKKNLFNSYYGMTVQNPCKPNYEFKDGMMQLKDETLDDLIKQYQAVGWLPYQWGVWVTAYARAKLHAGLQIIDPDDFIYSDTDSIKCMGDYSEAFNKLNEKYRRDDLSALDPKGNRHYIGIYEFEESYKRFKTMGAKKYAYEDQTGQLHITISGVNKRAGAAELGMLDRFKEGFIFRSGGGLAALYNDFPEVTEVKIQGHRLPISSNVALFESTYTLGLTMDYKKLILWLMNNDIKSALHYER